MWTSTLNLNFNRVLLTRLLGLVYPDIYYSSLAPLGVANIPRPTLPAADWVRVRNRLAGISGSDLHLVQGSADIRTSITALPHYKQIYPGHEVVGEVIEIGQDVQHLRVGDRVVLQYSPNCLSSGAKPVCHACTTGNYNLCEYGPLPGPQPIGGGWSEEMLLHEQQLFRLPNELSDEQGVILEPTAVALHAILRHLPQAEENVLIIGAGASGLLILQMLHALVPKARISILAHYPFQVEQATRLGVDHIVYPADPYTSVQRATHARLYKGILNNRTLTGGYDVIYDTLGQQKTLHHALRWLRTQGTMVLVGFNLQMMQIDLTPIWHHEINLLGSLSHGRETWTGVLTDILGTQSGQSTFSIVTELIQQKHIQPEQLVTHRFALNNYKAALIAARHNKYSQAIQVLFDYALLPVSAVPNINASARSLRPALAQPQGHAFTEEFLQAQQDREQGAIPQSNRAQQTIPAKIVDTPAPQAFTKEAWQNVLNRQDIEQDDTDDDTDPAIPAIKRPPFNPSVSSPKIPVTTLPSEPSLEVIVETPKTKTDESEANAISVQPTLESQQDEVTNEFLTSTDHTQSEVPVELPEPTSAFVETRDINGLTEEQLPTQTILDNLFDADTSSMPEFLAQLSNFGAPTAPEMPIEEAEAPALSETPIEEAEAPALPETPIEETEAPALPETPIEETGILALPETPIEETGIPALPETPVEEDEAPVLPDSPTVTLSLDSPDQTTGEQTGTISASSTSKAKKKRKDSKLAQTDITSNIDDQDEKKQSEGELIE